MEPESTVTKLPGPGEPSESAVTAVSKTVGRFAGLLTASSFAAFVYGAGYIAVNRTGDLLGVPAADPGVGTYVRGGYLFFLQSCAAIVEVALNGLTWPRGVGGWLGLAAAVALGWLAVMRVPPMLTERIGRSRLTAAAGWALLIAYGVATVVIIDAARKSLGVLEVDNLWFRETKYIKELSEPAQFVVHAIADGNERALRGFYRGAIASLTMGLILCLVALLAEPRLDFRAWRAPLRFAKWVPISSTLVLLLLLPSLYGVCFLIPKSVCVSLTLRSGTEIPTGMLLSELRSDAVEILVVETPPRVRRFERKDLESVELLSECRLLPGFASPPTSQIGR